MKKKSGNKGTVATKGSKSLVNLSCKAKKKDQYYGSFS